MKLAFSSNAFKQNTLAEAIHTITDIGYAGIEVMADRPHAWPADMTEQAIAELRDLIGQAGLGVSNVNAFTMFAVGDTWRPSWIEDDADLRRQRIEHTRKSLRLAGAIGAKTLSTEPGGAVEGVSRDVVSARFREGIEQVIGDAASAGVVICIEPEPALLIERPAEYLEFIKDFDTPWVKMNLDLGHMFCVGEDPARAVEELAGHYPHVHIEDIAATRVHQHLVPGQGAMDFEAIFRALERVGYDGWVTVELYPYVSSAEAVARQAYEFLRRFGF